MHRQVLEEDVSVVTAVTHYRTALHSSHIRNYRNDYYAITPPNGWLRHP